MLSPHAPDTSRGPFCQSERKHLTALPRPATIRKSAGAELAPPSHPDGNVNTRSWPALSRGTHGANNEAI